MQKRLLPIVCLFAIAVPAAFAGVCVSSPGSNSTVQSPVHYVASATTSCSKGVASMGIYTAPGVLAYTTAGSKLDTLLHLNSGTYQTVVEEWDYCGGVTTTPIKINVANQAGVQVSSPANNSTVGSPVNFSATASSTCAKGIASMGIYTAPNQLAYVVSGANLNTSLTLNPGTYNTVVQEWDNCGGAATTPITITVNSGAQVFSSIQAGGGWNGYILLPPSYNICTPCSPKGPQTTWWTSQNISSPSLTGRLWSSTSGDLPPIRMFSGTFTCWGMGRRIWTKTARLSQTSRILFTTFTSLVWI